MKNPFRTKYRIIEQYDTYFIQRKRFFDFFWLRYFGYHSDILKYDSRFPDLDTAKKTLQDIKDGNIPFIDAGRALREEEQENIIHYE